MRLRIKYCGGCNAAYDRVKFVKSLIKILETDMPGQWEISYNAKPADIGILVCGCSALCADRDLVELDTPPPAAWHIVGPDLLDYRQMNSEQIINSLADDLKNTLGKQA